MLYETMNYQTMSLSLWTQLNHIQCSCLLLPTHLLDLKKRNQLNVRTSKQNISKIKKNGGQIKEIHTN